MAESDMVCPDRRTGQFGPLDGPKMEMLKFIFTSRLNLFNTRREHEWRVIISALVLIGAVDASLVAQHLTLTDRQMDFWSAALLILLVSIGFYQWGVQQRNRADRIVMDSVLNLLCNDMRIPRDSPIRSGLDREDPRVPCWQTDIIFHRTYIWAFLAQMIVLILATALSMYLPTMIKETSAAKPAVQVQPSGTATRGPVASLAGAARADKVASPNLAR